MSKKTARAIDESDWMHSGHLATMDKDGYVDVVGRLKGRIIRGSENIYPREIEEFLYTHPDVVDAQVIAVPDERFGEVIMAWIQLEARATLSEDEVRALRPSSCLAALKLRNQMTSGLGTQRRQRCCDLR